MCNFKCISSWTLVSLACFPKKIEKLQTNHACCVTCSTSYRKECSMAVQRMKRSTMYGLWLHCRFRWAVAFQYGARARGQCFQPKKKNKLFSWETCLVSATAASQEKRSPRGNHCGKSDPSTTTGCTCWITCTNQAWIQCQLQTSWMKTWWRLCVVWQRRAIPKL